jgi:L-fuculose-phosphate aldolase
MKYLNERQQVLNAAREISTSRMVVGTWGNVSIKIDNQPLILITPSGMRYDTMTIEDIVLVDKLGNIVEGKWKPSVELPTHAEIYWQRPDVKAIVHVHSPYATAFAVARLSIPVIMEETAQVIGHEIFTAPYAICGSSELAAHAVNTLGAGKAVLLANHGLVGVGENISAALRVCYIAEETARVALLAQSLGQVYPLSPDEIIALQRGFSTYGQQKAEIDER